MEECEPSSTAALSAVAEIGSLYKKISASLSTHNPEARSSYARYFQGWLTGKIPSTTFDSCARKGLPAPLLNAHKDIILTILRLEMLDDSVPSVLPLLKRCLLAFLKANRENSECEPLDGLEPASLLWLAAGVDGIVKNLLESVLYRKWEISIEAERKEENGGLEQDGTDLRRISMQDVAGLVAHGQSLKPVGSFLHKMDWNVCNRENSSTDVSESGSA